MAGLTPKQEKFVQNMVLGMSQRAAYKDAYPNTNMKDSTCDENASRLFKNSKVKARYEEIMSMQLKQARWTKDMAVEKLLFLVQAAEESIQKDGVRQANSGAFLNSVKELNAIENVYEKSKLEVDYLKAKLNLIKGEKKDTSLLEAVLEVLQDE